MALVTVQRSPSPSTDHDADSLSEYTTDGKSHLKKRLKTSKQKLRKVFSSVRFLSKLRPGLSESYFAYKGAALILPHTECTRKSSKKSHGGEIQDHLQAMLLLLRPEDQIKIAVRLEDVPQSVYKRYICVVSTRGRQDTEEAVILGMDCRHGEAVIGLVLPVWLGVKIQLQGDGSFRLCTDEQAYLFNPVSVQAMWSAIQSLVKVVHNAEEMKYIHDGLTHTWVEYYRSRIDHAHVTLNHHWNIEGVDVFIPTITDSDKDEESVKRNISNTMKVVMLSVDLEDVTCKALRLAVEERIGFSIQKYKTFFDEEMIRIFGQMEGPSKIMDYLYLGSEWNASNLHELKAIGIGYILNVTKEIDNFFAGTFQYYTVRVVDVPESDLLRHWDKTFKFISKARSHGSKVFVHCKMGISRSASTTMAYLMKENRWSVDEAYKFVKERRGVARPNEGFMEQLKMYEAILSASNQRYYFNTKDVDQPTSPTEGGGMPGEEGEEEVAMEQDYDCMLGDSMMASHWMNLGPSPSLFLEEDLEHLHDESRLLPDLEGTESRSGDSLEESLPDFLPSSLSAEKQVIGTSVDGPIDQACGGVNPNTSPGGLFKVKPDSFWIKQEDEEMEDNTKEEQAATSSELDDDCIEMADAEKAGSENCRNQKITAAIGDHRGLTTSSSINETCCEANNKPKNPSCLSQIHIQDQSSSLLSSSKSSSPTHPTSSDQQSDNNVSFHAVSGADSSSSSSSSSSELSISLSQISTHDAHSSSPISLPDVPMKELGNPLHKHTNPNTTSTWRQNLTTQIDSSAQQDTSAGKQCAGGGVSKCINEPSDAPDTTHPYENTCTQSNAFNSMQSKDGSGSGSNPSTLAAIKAASTSPPPPNVRLGKVESGVRDYFFREKIPWNPGKVQKIRDGINREGIIKDVVGGEDGRSGGGGGDYQDVMGEGELAARSQGDGGEVEDSLELIAGRQESTVQDEDKGFKMDIDKEKIILDESMDVSSPKKECQMESKEGADGGGAALSLYEKEEIQLEPGTVLRTRMEIEERQKCRQSCGDVDMQTPDSPTKPVLRTSSLKASSKDSVDHQTDSNLPPRRVSCGPVMERIRYLRKMDQHYDEDGDENGDDLMTEEEADDDEAEAPTRFEDVMPDEEAGSKCQDFQLVDGSNLNCESFTDSEKTEEDNSGMVKSFVRKLENHPFMDQKTASVENVMCTDSNTSFDACGEIQFKPPASSFEEKSTEGKDVKINLGFVSGESNTDGPCLLDESSADPQLCATAKADATATVRHLVGQFETKTPQETVTKTNSGNELLENFEPCSLQSGDHELVASVEIADGASVKPPSNNISLSSSVVSVLSETKDPHSAEVSSSLSLSPLKSTIDDVYSTKDDKHREVWNPYQQISPDSTIEDISSLRQKFEARSSSCEGGASGGGGGVVRQRPQHQSVEKNRKLPRPKSIERMCGLFEGKCKSDTSLTEERKDYTEATTFRQVSEEGRKVRRLHGKSHPLTKLSQGRGVFHSSM